MIDTSASWEARAGAAAARPAAAVSAASSGNRRWTKLGGRITYKNRRGRGSRGGDGFWQALAEGGPDVELRAHARDDLVCELARRGVAADVRGAHPAGRGLHHRLVDRARCGLGAVVAYGGRVAEECRRREDHRHR